MIQISEMLQLDEELKNWKIDSDQKYKLISSDKSLLNDWQEKKKKFIFVSSQLSPACKDYLHKAIEESESYFERNEKKGFLDKYGRDLFFFGLGFLTRDGIGIIGKNFAETLKQAIYSE